MCRLLTIAIVSSAGATAARAAATDGRLVFPIDQRWTTVLGGQVSASPVVADGRVFLVIEGREVFALALADGAPLWATTIDSAFAPVAGNEQVFVAVPDGVVALDQATGADRWRAPIGAAAVPPSWRNGWLLVVTDAPELAALRASDGAVIWREALASPAAAPPAVEGDRVYVPLQDGRLIARRIDTGGELWETRLGGPGRGVAAFADRIYVGSLDNRFYCLAARNGHELWNWRTGADVVGGAVVDAERVYFVSFDNLLYALDRRSGVRRWRTQLPARAVGPPSPADRAVFVPVATRALLFAPRELGKPVARLALTRDLFTASPFDETRDVTLVIVTVDAGGTAHVDAFGTAVLPPLEPLTAPPGLGVGRPVPLVTRALPVQYLALPALPRRGA